jgi:hypothetical protein
MGLSLRSFVFTLRKQIQGITSAEGVLARLAAQQANGFTR